VLLRLHSVSDIRWGFVACHAVDSKGRLIVADNISSYLRRITLVETLDSLTPDGTEYRDLTIKGVVEILSEGPFNQLTSSAIDRHDNAFVSDETIRACTYCIRRVDATTGAITLVVGNINSNVYVRLFSYGNIVYWFAQERENKTNRLDRLFHIDADDQTAQPHNTSMIQSHGASVVKPHGVSAVKLHGVSAVKPHDVSVVKPHVVSVVKPHVVSVV
jgi:hypothetical protein